MANLINIHAETGADIIGDDAQPTLTLSNTSTGPGLLVRGLAVVSTASLDNVNLTGNLIIGGTLTGGAQFAFTSISSVASLRVGGPILAAAATVTNFHLAGASRASGALMAIKGDGFVSAVSLIFAAGAGWAGMGAIRVVRTDGTFGWIPVLPDAQVTAAAVP